ncbi:MAG: permease [Muribaculaceae bacterium]|nr:permease [Muribaculaceae bacterium]
MNIQHLTYTLADILNEMSPYILLGFLIAGLLHVFVQPDVMSRHLAGHGWKPVLKAAMFGIPLPLCSCGVLPTAVALRRQGASKGASASFLIATPQTGVDSIAATYALLGLPFALLRPIAALTGAFAGGMAVDRLSGKDDTICGDTCTPRAEQSRPRPLMRRLLEAVRYGFVDMVGSVGKWLVIGLIIAAIITVAVPDSLFLSLRSYPLLAMLVMVAVAVPMYICATGSIPIALSLMLKGLTPGVAFVLLMAGPAANFASVMVLRKSLGNRATAVYIGSVILTAIAFGLIIDCLLPAAWFAPSAAISTHGNCHTEFPLFPTLCSALLIALLIYAFIRSRRESHKFKNTETTMTTITYLVKGMSCNHCKASVEKALRALPGTENVSVDLSSGKVAVDGEASTEAIEKAVTDAGFEFAGKL